MPHKSEGKLSLPYYSSQSPALSCQILPRAGHHVYADRAASFNSAVVKTCAWTDRREERRRKKIELDLRGALLDGEGHVGTVRGREAGK